MAYSGAKVQSRFYTGDLISFMADREIRSVSMRVCMYTIFVSVSILNLSVTPNRNDHKCDSRWLPYRKKIYYFNVTDALQSSIHSNLDYLDLNNL